MDMRKYNVENSVRAYRAWKRSGVPCKLVIYDRECFKINGVPWRGFEDEPENTLWKEYCTRVVATFDGFNEFVSARCPYKKSQL